MINYLKKYKVLYKKYAALMKENKELRKKVDNMAYAFNDDKSKLSFKLIEGSKSVSVTSGDTNITLISSDDMAAFLTNNNISITDLRKALITTHYSRTFNSQSLTETKYVSLAEFGSQMIYKILVIPDVEIDTTQTITVNYRIMIP